MNESVNHLNQPTTAQLHALRRLWDWANNYSGQCRVVAAFLLSLYNGRRFPFDLTDLRVLDQPIFRDCMLVLEMDYCPKDEVHNVLRLPGRRFEELADRWRIRDHERMIIELRELKGGNDSKY